MPDPGRGGAKRGSSPRRAVQVQQQLQQRDAVGEQRRYRQLIYSVAARRSPQHRWQPVVCQRRRRHCLHVAEILEQLLSAPRECCGSVESDPIPLVCENGHVRQLQVVQGQRGQRKHTTLASAGDPMAQAADNKRAAVCAAMCDSVLKCGAWLPNGSIRAPASQPASSAHGVPPNPSPSCPVLILLGSCRKAAAADAHSPVVFCRRNGLCRVGGTPCSAAADIRCLPSQSCRSGSRGFYSDGSALAGFSCRASCLTKAVALSRA